MSSKSYYVGKAHWGGMLQRWLEKYTILAPQPQKGGLFFTPVTSENISSIVYDEARAVQPLKTFLFPALEEVVGNDFTLEKPWLFLNVKACDLQAISILDQALGGDFTDPHYRKKRSESIFISSDCTQPWETCFCTLVGGKPYAEKGFDLNLSKIGGEHCWKATMNL
jgi:hypothetical protein